ncbi:MAG: hypothetical protein AAFQ27_13205, partial [Pseudomonadota bacterium]
LRGKRRGVSSRAISCSLVVAKVFATFRRLVTRLVKFLERERLSCEDKRRSAAEHNQTASEILLSLLCGAVGRAGEGDRFRHAIYDRGKILTSG